MKGTMIIDGRKVEFEDEKNVLEVVRKAGIELPTFCYHSELSLYGACRMCIVEDKNGKIFASCSTLQRMVWKYSPIVLDLKDIEGIYLELLLANHDKDCTTCEKTGDCALQTAGYKIWN